HGDEGLAAVRIDVEGEHRGDVRMREQARLARLALQRDIGVLVTLHVAAQQLDRDMWAWIACLLEQQVPGLPYLSHRAGPEELLEAVSTPDQIPEPGRRGRALPGCAVDDCRSACMCRPILSGSCWVRGARAIHRCVRGLELRCDMLSRACSGGRAWPQGGYMRRLLVCLACAIVYAAVAATPVPAGETTT